jgi:hypothetical protein
MAIRCGFFAPRIRPTHKAEYQRKLTKLRLLRHYPVNIDIEELRTLWEYLIEATPALFQELLSPLTQAEVALGRSERWIIEPGSLRSKELIRVRKNLDKVLRETAIAARAESAALYRTNGVYAMSLLAQTLAKWTRRRQEAVDSGNLTKWEKTWGRKLQKRFTKWSLRYVEWELEAMELMQKIDFRVDVALVLDNSGLTDDVEELYREKNEKPYRFPRRLCEDWKMHRPNAWVWQSNLSPSEGSSTRNRPATPTRFLLRKLLCLGCPGIEGYVDVVRAMSVIGA